MELISLKKTPSLCIDTNVFSRSLGFNFWITIWIKFDIIRTLINREVQKDWSPQEICFERIYRWKGSVNSRLKDILIINQKKAFYRQKIPESSWATKETVDTDRIITCGTSCRKITQSIRIISSRLSSGKREWNHLKQFRWTFTKVKSIEKI